MDLSTTDLYLIFIYLMAILAIGLYLSGRANKPEAFMLAKRTLPGWLLGFSIFATYVSNISLIGTTGKVFMSNWSPLAINFAFPIAIFISAKYFIPFHRKQNHASAYTHLEQFFGPWSTIYAVITDIFLQIFRMATIMYLISLALAPILDVNQWTIITITGVVVIAYTFAGGIEAVIWTDFIQGLLLVGGVIISIIYIFFNMPEGPSQVFSLANQFDKFSLGSFKFSFTDQTFWTTFVLGLTMYFQGFGINQTTIQRYMSAKSTPEAKKSLMTTFYILLPFAICLTFLGTALFTFYAANPDVSTAQGIDSLNPDSIYPHFIANQLPNGIRGILIAAILASGMSSIDSSLNSISTIFLTNIYSKYINRHPGQKRSMFILHAVSIICGIFAILLAISMISLIDKSIWDNWFAISTVLSGTVFGLFLLGFLFRKYSARAGIIAVFSGALCMAWFTTSKFLPTYLQCPIHGLLKGAVTTIVMLVAGSLVYKLSVKVWPEA